MPENYNRCISEAQIKEGRKENRIKKEIVEAIGITGTHNRQHIVQDYIK